MLPNFLGQVSWHLFSQTPRGFIHPNTSYSNPSPDTLVYLPKQNLESLMDRDETSRMLIAALEKRSEVCDSALALKASEAENWYKKLKETDDLLLQEEINSARQARRHKRMCKVWFAAGAVLSWAVCTLW